MSPRSQDVLHDVIVVGGGPAGLSAALVLGRCRRDILVFDSGAYRNAAAREVHAFLTRDGTAPSELLAHARAQLERYGVEVRRARVTDARRRQDGFEVELEDGAVFAARHLLLATGVVDHLPAVEGFEAFLGHGVYHCPYCDAWEVRDQPLAVFGHGQAGLDVALALLTWSPDVALLTHGPARLRAPQLERLARHGIDVHPGKIRRLEGGGELERVVFESGEVLYRRAIFFSTGQRQHSELAVGLGCEVNASGAVRTDRWEQSTVTGVYVVGDASQDPQLAIIAAAEGAKAACAINKSLQAAERR